MKILISPSKTQNKNIDSFSNNEENILFTNKTNELNDLLIKSINNEKFNSWLELKNNSLIEETIKDIKEFKNNKAYKAIEFYDGLQFKNILYSQLSETQKTKLNESLIIISGFYGIVFPNSYIKPYRLMLGSKINIPNYKNLYDFWFKEFNQKLEELNPDKLIINLASGEYSKLIDNSIFNVINVDFKLFKSNKYVSLSTFSKQCRGYFINQFLNINLDINKIKDLDILGFKFNNELSYKNNYIFTKAY
ncbi:YaaA family protein [Malacoplasma penetrans]|uniref:UPF0246 protein MYPE6270 n=1 Tax=Malacoplasma penetrans (strain HF-2) TaxID=272633 RepID=Y627_MALP2|nr:YaaA family protein [Malacoplasma penetrans]Q8EVD7.1 RecName: Full=UPF0246 protein MYPE6270 [Malacoplasma penetrans HF-2]RXY96095.1 YaaA family protein [Malacoplasma penetrans]BAC44417.1 conserved hypothetical protein [Malacoplasma penetrans HF-2]